MPFTFSHPAAILPLKYLPKRFYSFTGLIVGSMIPDFEYFIRMTVGSIYRHTLPGLFYFDVPLGIIICFIFHDIVRDTVIDNLPGTLRQRFRGLTYFDWNTAFINRWPIIILSILIGAASHILWDDFTHVTGYFVKKYSILQRHLHIAGFSIPYYNIFQQLSSLVGALVIVLFILKMPNQETPQGKSISRYWICVFVISFIIMTIRFLNGLTLLQYGNVIVSAISAFMISLIIIPFFYFGRKS